MMQALYERYPVRLYNYLYRKKVPFAALRPPHVGMYVCGPTVYGEPHLGHIRTALAFDLIYRYLSTLGYSVRYVRNITDVGHLEGIEEGEDKILKQAAMEQREPMEIAEQYSYSYHQALQALNIIRPAIEPRASGHITEQIELVQAIMKAGYAYESDKTIYFDLAKYMADNKGLPYGLLSGKKVEDLRVGVRDIKQIQSKRESLDFALWKPAGPQHSMSWPSPWGRGYPGWHLECTAMSTKYLGKQFDIHGGGLDLQFPHHEAEIAQNHAAYATSPANYWVYANLLSIDGQKMSKSLGNFITIDQVLNGGSDLLREAVHPNLLRFFMLKSHYRSPVDFSEEQIHQSQSAMERLAAYYMHAQKIAGNLNSNETESCNVDARADSNPEVIHTLNQDPSSNLCTLVNNLYHSMSDDFNTPRVIAALFDLGSSLQSEDSLPCTMAAKQFCTFYEEVLGLKPAESTRKNSNNKDLVNLLVSLRNEMRSSRNFQLADRIRDGLREAGIELQDAADGTVVME